MPDFKNFSFKNVSVIWGIIELEGFAEGDDVVTIESDADQFTKKVGAKGDVTRTQTADNSCTITIKLLQTSRSNALLNAQFTLDKETGSNPAPMFINDKESGEAYAINNAWVQKFPTVTRGQGDNTMDWVFQGDFLTPVILNT